MTIMTEELWHRYHNGQSTHEAKAHFRQFSLWPRHDTIIVRPEPWWYHRPLNPNAHNPSGYATLGGHTQ